MWIWNQEQFKWKIKNYDTCKLSWIRWPDLLWHRSMFHLCSGKLWVLYFRQNLISVQLCDAEGTQPANPSDVSHGISMTTYRCTVCYMLRYQETNCSQIFPTSSWKAERPTGWAGCRGWCWDLNVETAVCESCRVKQRQVEQPLSGGEPGTPPSLAGLLVGKRNGHWQVSNVSEKSRGGPLQGSQSLPERPLVWLTSRAR